MLIFCMYEIPVSLQSKMVKRYFGSRAYRTPSPFNSKKLHCRLAKIFLEDREQRKPLGGILLFFQNADFTDPHVYRYEDRLVQIRGQIVVRNKPACKRGALEFYINNTLYRLTMVFTKFTDADSIGSNCVCAEFVVSHYTPNDNVFFDNKILHQDFSRIEVLYSINLSDRVPKNFPFSRRSDQNG